MIVNFVLHNIKYDFGLFASVFTFLKNLVLLTLGFLIAGLEQCLFH